MKHLIAALFMVMSALPAQAQCYADYKAKRDGPLRLLYGVVELSAQACTKEAAASKLAPALAKEGWQLLTIVSLFSEDRLDGKREAAGAHFLRY